MLTVIGYEDYSNELDREITYFVNENLKTVLEFSLDNINQGLDLSFCFG